MESRRSLLKRLAGAAGVAAAGSGAGCTATFGEHDGDAPAYADPLYDPTRVLDADGAAFLSYDLGALYDERGHLPGGTGAGIERYGQGVDAVALSALGRLTGIGYWRGDRPTAGTPTGGSAVLAGSFEPAKVRRRLRETTGVRVSATAVGTVSDHDVYELTVPTGVGPVAAGDSLALATDTTSLAVGGVADADATARTPVKTILESADGGEPGYYESSDVGARILDAVGDATMVTGVETTVASLTGRESSGDGPLDAVASGLQGVGHAATLGGGDVTARVVGVYAEGETPTVSDLENLRTLATQVVGEAAAAELESVELSVGERTATATYTTTPGAAFRVPTLGPRGAGDGGIAPVLVFPVVAALASFVLEGGTPSPP